jgi:hypothetical protein
MKNRSRLPCIENVEEPHMVTVVGGPAGRNFGRSNFGGHNFGRGYLFQALTRCRSFLLPD